MIVDINDVCACYNLFILFETGILLTKVYPEFVLTIEVTVIVDDDLDCCRHIDNSFYFCNTYYGMIVEKQISKFGFANCINVLPYQKYIDALSNLTPIKEIFIAYVPLIISVIKLSPSGISITTFYHQI